jgi:glycosyltransferase involved in cell wall biosynthesis
MLGNGMMAEAGCPARERSLDLGIVMPGTSRTWPSSCIYIHAEPFSWTWFAGIPRYTARLSMALAAHVPVRFFDEGWELLPPRKLIWSQDQDLEQWGRRIWQGRRQPLETPPADCIGLYCSTRPGKRIFPYEASILHDFCPLVVPWAFPDAARDVYEKPLTEDILASDLVVSDSHSTKADAAWFSALDPERIVVAPPGPSLCVATHRHRGRVARSDRIGLVVSTIEPRKNAGFLFDWFHKTTLLPPDMELWWVGKLGWMTSQAELQRMANPPGGRRVRFLGNVSDARLCRLYQKAGWSIYPSRYEGFGFPILDSLRHGTPVLSSGTSSMGEFDHPGVFFFDPQDPATVDLAWQRFQAAKPVTISQARLDDLYNWDLVARALLDAHARSRAEVAAGLPQSRPPAPSGAGAGQAAGSPFPPPNPGSEKAVSPDVRSEAGLRIGIELFAIQTAGHQRSVGRYSRNLVATLLARDAVNEYVLYGQDGLTTDPIPTAPNSVVRLLRPDSARGETTLTHALERLTATNPDSLDVLLLLNPLESAPGYDLPAKPLSGLKMVAVVRDLIPLLFQEEYSSRWPGPEFAPRYFQALNRLRSYDALLAISEAARRDFLSLLGLSPDRVKTIGTASDGRYFAPDRADSMPAESRAILRARGITLPFVFSAGSPEYPKSPWGLIDAFAMLPDTLRRSHQLVLAYDLSGADSDRVWHHASDRDVADRLVVIDRVADPALRVLYQQCAAFVFLSSYEGFGLPILEAMHCGAPVVAGNNPSQIEVVGDAGLFFNVADAGELAARLVQVLDDADRARELRERAVVQARRFHWEETAEKALDVLTRSHAPEPSVHPRSGRRRVPKRRIAFFSPLPPLRSEVSDYSARLLDELKRRYTIDLYHDAGYFPHIGLRSHDFGCYDYRLFERNARVLDYHALVYQMGNSPYHGYMYETLLRHPGIVTLHELNIAEFHFWYAHLLGVDGSAHIQHEFEAFCGAGSDEVLRGLAAFADAPGGILEACIQQGYHLNGRIFEQASAVIVHSPWCVGQVRSRLPAHLSKTYVVALGATALNPSAEQRSAVRARFEMPPRALIIASLGLLHSSKMNSETIAAFAPLARAIPEALLIFFGKEIDDGEARRQVMELGLQHRVRFLGHCPDDLDDLAAIADIGVCLRRPPTKGETSGALLDLLRLGVPTIVSDVGSFSCYPDSVVRKHRWDPDGLAGLTHALRELAEDRPRREVLGRAAWHYVHRNHAWPRAADSYEEIIERTIAGRTRPQANGTSALPCPQVVASPEWFQAASCDGPATRLQDRTAGWRVGQVPIPNLAR